MKRERQLKIQHNTFTIICEHPLNDPPNPVADDCLELWCMRKSLDLSMSITVPRVPSTSTTVVVPVLSSDLPPAGTATPRIPQEKRYTKMLQTERPGVVQDAQDQQSLRKISITGINRQQLTRVYPYDDLYWLSSA